MAAKVQETDFMTNVNTLLSNSDISINLFSSRILTHRITNLKTDLDNLVYKVFRYACDRDSKKDLSMYERQAGYTLVDRLLKWQAKRIIDWDNMDGDIILGIDEHSFRGKKMLTVITDLKNKKMLTILKSDNQKELTIFFKNMPDSAKKRIKEVCTDLRFSYRSCVRGLFPNVDIVADRFHVELQAKRALDQLRSVIEIQMDKKYYLKKILLKYNNQLDDNERKRLELIFDKYKKYPALKELYIAKEHIRKIYFCQNKKQAKKQFDHCIMLLETTHHSRYITALRKTLIRWEKQILNYYNNKTTNGFTEGCNNKIKMVKRMSFGFTKVENYIAKMLLAFTPLFFGTICHTI